MAIAIFGLPKKCNFCQFYIHTSVADANCATRQKGKKKHCWGGFGEVSNTRQHW
jgi:hypothetical protein